MTVCSTMGMCKYLRVHEYRWRNTVERLRCYIESSLGGFVFALEIFVTPLVSPEIQEISARICQVCQINEDTTNSLCSIPSVFKRT